MKVDFKEKMKDLGFRVLRLVGVLLLIYVSMVFYMALTERRNAYPRAIAHEEARNAIKGHVQGITCTLSDGTILNGFQRGHGNSPVLLYYPDADEDCAQFIAEVDSIPGVTIASFNYRGSAENKGTPEHKTFIPDSKEILECADQISEAGVEFIAGRGSGAILAGIQQRQKTQTILIDPVLSIADAIAEKYRIFYPRFLIRAQEELPIQPIKNNANRTAVLLDRKSNETRSTRALEQLGPVKVFFREEKTLQQSMTSILQNKNP